MLQMSDEKDRIEWANRTTLAFSSLIGIHEIFHKRKAPCTIRSALPLLRSIMQVEIDEKIFKIIQDISHGLVEIEDAKEFKKKVRKKNKYKDDYIDVSLKDDDKIINIGLASSSSGFGNQKGVCVNKYDKKILTERFQSLLGNYFKNNSSVSLPNLLVSTAPEKSTKSTNDDSKTMSITQFITQLIESDKFDFKSKIVYRHRWKGRDAKFSQLPTSLFEDKTSFYKCLGNMNIQNLYSHQAQAITAIIERNQNIVITTSTASGKSLSYIIPILNSYLSNESVTSFMIFPTKALAQDQLKSLKKWIQTAEISLNISCFDGDTLKSDRQHIRENNDILLINPDILHVSILPYHKSWVDFFSRLKYVIIDEGHMYKGAFGIHVALILRRLRRIAAAYGASPTFIICSATMSNALDHGATLTGLPVSAFELVDEDGSPCGDKEILFFNPFASSFPSSQQSSNSHHDEDREINNSDDGSSLLDATRRNNNSNGRGSDSIESTSLDITDQDVPPVMKENLSNEIETEHPSKNYFYDKLFDMYETHISPYENTAMLAEQLVNAQVRTLIFVKARYIAEHLLELIQKRLPAELRPTVGSYRGGFIATDRRIIESKLKSGELLVVVTTNALELGIDIGSLDCTLHLGFPGSFASFKQQAGRAGRAGQSSLAVYIALHSPLEQFYMSHPQYFFNQSFGALALNVANEIILKDHLLCSAHEMEFDWMAAKDPVNEPAVADDNNKHSLNTSDKDTALAESMDEDSSVEECEKSVSNNLQSDPLRDPTVWFGGESILLLHRGLEEGLYKIQDKLNGDVAGKSKVLVPRIKQHPAGDISIRTADENKVIQVVNVVTGQAIETMQYSDALMFLHEGAIHMNLGNNYEVVRLDLDKLIAHVVPCQANHYTQHLGHMTVSIKSVAFDKRIVYGKQQQQQRPRVYLQDSVASQVNINSHVEKPRAANKEELSAMLRVGPVEATKHVHAYRVRDKRTSKVKNILPITQPAFAYPTRAVWSEVPQPIVERIHSIYCNPSLLVDNNRGADKPPPFRHSSGDSSTTRSDDRDVTVELMLFRRKGFLWKFDELYFRFGLHAVEHLIIALAPTMIMCDVADLSCQHTRKALDMNRCHLLLFETQRGGFGLAEQIYSRWFDLLEAAYALVKNCPCIYGCPSCCHLPSCGDFNEHLDKQMARLILAFLVGDETAVMPTDIGLVLDEEVNEGKKKEVPVALPTETLDKVIIKNGKKPLRKRRREREEM